MTISAATMTGLSSVYAATLMPWEADDGGSGHGWVTAVRSALMTLVGQGHLSTSVISSLVAGGVCWGDDGWSWEGRPRGEGRGSLKQVIHNILLLALICRHAERRGPVEQVRWQGLGPQWSSVRLGWYNHRRWSWLRGRC